MSDSTTPLDTISQSQSQKEATANAALNEELERLRAESLAQLGRRDEALFRSDCSSA